MDESASALHLGPRGHRLRRSGRHRGSPRRAGPLASAEATDPRPPGHGSRAGGTGRDCVCPGPARELVRLGRSGEREDPRADVPDAAFNAAQKLFCAA